MTVTCLGCGCACDDLEVRVRDGVIESVAPPCPLAQRWFGSGKVPNQAVVAGRLVGADEAVAAAADLLGANAGRVLVLLAPDLTAEAQRFAVGVADSLRAVLDSATSATAAQGILVAQRRGRAAATLGEIRNRADVLLFWGVDPAERYPRYLERYALEPVGTQVPAGRRGRTVISVSIGKDRAPAGADLELSVGPDQEITALSVIRATILGNPVAELPEGLHRAADIGHRLLQARYAAVIHDGEPAGEAGDPARTEGLIALVQALNGSTRAAISTLRAGGNRSGAESVLTWQTGFPMAVDFSEGLPRYEPDRRGLDRVAGGAFTAVLVVGSAAALTGRAAAALGGLPIVAIGPRASEFRPQPRVAIDTGIAGIHESGTGYRMDDVPLPLTPPLSGVRGAAPTLGALLTALRERRRSA